MDRQFQTRPESRKRNRHLGKHRRAYVQYTSSRPLSTDAKKEIFGILLIRSSAPAEETLEKLRLKFLTPDEARAVVALYSAEAVPISVIGP